MPRIDPRDPLARVRRFNARCFVLPVTARDWRPVQARGDRRCGYRSKSNLRRSAFFASFVAPSVKP